MDQRAIEEHIGPTTSKPWENNGTSRMINTATTLIKKSFFY